MPKPMPMSMPAPVPVPCPAPTSSRRLPGGTCRAPRPAAAGLAAAVLGVSLLAGCSAYSPRGVEPGQSVADVESRMGPPTGRYTLPGGTQRLEYARGPFGKHTYMVDADADGRVLGWTQVLDEAHFNALKPGMSGEAVRQAIGRPSETFGIGWQGLGVWAYRYEVTGNFCKWFMVTVDPGQRVTETSYGPDPMCDGGRGDLGDRN